MSDDLSPNGLVARATSTQEGTSRLGESLQDYGTADWLDRVKLGNICPSCLYRTAEPELQAHVDICIPPPSLLAGQDVDSNLRVLLRILSRASRQAHPNRH